MQVTQDEYELPVAVADSLKELAEMTGTTQGSISSWMWHYRSGRLKTRKYIKVIITERQENDE